MGHHGPQPAASLPFYKPLPVWSGGVGHAGGLEEPLDLTPDRLGGAGDREGGELRVGIVGGFDLDRPKPLGKGLRDRFRVPAGVDGRGIDAAAAAVDGHTLSHHVEVPLPVVHAVVAEDEL